jgi:hypothetical protein
MLTNPAALVVALVALAFAYVLVPVFLAGFFRYRRTVEFRCPEAGVKATVRFLPLSGGLKEALGADCLAVGNCTLWPERAGCEQKCARGRSAAA